VLEADKISHALIEPAGAAYPQVIARFGPAIVSDDGRINRTRLGRIVFADREKLDQLNGILHPLVEHEVQRQLAELEESGRFLAAFVEAALIYEAGFHRKLDGVAVAWCLPEQQLARLMERGMGETEARQRIATQMPVQEKLALAEEKIDCSGSMEETRCQVEALAARLRTLPHSD